MADQRYRWGYRLRYALEHRDRVVPYLRRATRNLFIRVRHRGHTSFYREVMRRNIDADANLAVGSASHDRWLALGALQYDYLLEHGLEPHHRMLEIGCGNLRAGWRFIEHLEPGHYYGIDASPDILLSALQTVAERKLQDKLPHLTPVADLRLEFLPAGYFDVVHAHSVFSHTPLATIEECLAHVGRVLAPGGFFDLTFNATHGREHHVLQEDFYYRPGTLVRLAERHGLTAELMEDWSPRHKQDKLRLRPAAD